MQQLMVKNKSTTNLTIKNITSIICLILIALPLLVVCARYDGLNFLLYIAFWVMIPGYFLLQGFTKQGLACKTNSLSFIYAFILGSGSLFIEFFILHLFNGIELIKYINPAICIIALIFYYKNYKYGNQQIPNIKKNFRNVSKHLPFILLWLIATYLCAFVLNFFMPNMPTITYVDYTWQIGNINQLSSATPFEDIRVAGIEFKYHYFNALFYAIEKIIFDTTAWVIFIQHQIFIVPLLISLSFYNLFNTIVKNNWIASLFSLFALTSFGLSHHYSNFMFNWSSNMNAVGLTTVASCALFFALKPLLHRNTVLNKTSIIQIIFSALLLVYLSGFKGPYGAVYLLAVVCFIIMRLLRKIKPTKVIIISLVFSSALFLLMYNLLFSSGASTYLSYNLFEGILTSVTKIPFFDVIPYLPGLRFIMFIPSLMLTFTLLFFPLVLCAIDCLLYVFGKRDLCSDIIFASFVTVIGTVAFYFFDITGGVQIYFLYCALPFAGYIALNKTLEIIENRPRLKRVSVILLICFSFTGVLFNFYLPLHESTYAETAPAFLGTEQTFDKQTQEEFAAYEFLKQYPNDGKLVFCTRSTHFNDDYANFYYISAYTEKPNYFEGYLYAQRNLAFADAPQRLLEREDFFTDETTAEEKYIFAKEKNIAYIFMFENDGYDNAIFTTTEAQKYFKTIFSNDSISIYEILS